MVGPDANLKNKLINWHGSSVERGHSGREITLKFILLQGYDSTCLIDCESLPGLSKIQN